jgi:hypothetical protein
MRTQPVDNNVFLQDFERPDLFRRRMEQSSETEPSLKVPAWMVYIALISALVYWVYTGYWYNRDHHQIAGGILVVYIIVLLSLFTGLMWFRAYHRRIRIYPHLRRVAEDRPGAFLFISNSSPILFYARERWIAKVTFVEGDDSQNAFTRLDAVTRNPSATVHIARKNVFDKILKRSIPDLIPLPPGNFGEKFNMWSEDAASAVTLMTTAIPDALLQLNELGHPQMDRIGHVLSVQLDKDLSSPWRQSKLTGFLEYAERIVEAVA